MDKKRKTLSIKWILLLTYIAVSIVPLVMFSSVIFKATENYYVEERKKELLNQANIFAGHITISDYLFDAEKKGEFDEDIENTSTEGGYRTIVVDSTGTVINDSNRTETGKMYLIPEIIEALDNKDIAKLQPNGSIYAVASIADEAGQKVGAVLIADMPSDIAEKMAEIKHQVYVLLAMVVSIVGCLVFWFAHIITEPLNKMMQVIEKIADGHLDQRLPVKQLNYHEMEMVSQSVNDMATKLEQVDSSRQQFVSNVSHELKTPLSSIKVLSESLLMMPDAPKEMYVEFMGDINSEVDRMTEIINDLLTLVRLDQKEIPVNFVNENLNKVIGDIVKRLQPIAGSKNINLVYDEIKDVNADIDETKFTLAISNLVENGIKYTDDGGEVKVVLDSDHQNVFITVSDTGIGMAEEELSKIFQRFYRIDKTRDRETGGTGLGLAITHSTVLMHNGSIKVSSKENEGTTFVVRIPLVNSNLK
ncbi:MAG: HAMP domain-containing histidine kinase [Firmicutes bacterium]|nr:HAMP domain-containing histidine kinase [Bacillota bacterium]